MSKRRPSWTLAGFMALSALLPLAARADPGCRRVTLESSPRWISSAVFSEKLQGVVVVDPFQNKLLLVSPEGAKARVTPLPDPPLSSDFLPATLAKAGPGFLLKLVGTQMLKLDDRLEKQGIKDLGRESKSPRGRIGSLYQWTVAGDALLGFGSIAHEDGSFELGFLRVPLEAPAQVKMVKRFDEGDFYALGYPLVASLPNGDGYFVLMSEHPAIYRVPAGGGNVEPLAAFPEGYRDRPVFKTKMTGPSTAPAHFRELEGFTMPAGLYGGPDGLLYLLTRKPAGATTEWQLHQIDPAANKGAGRVVEPPLVLPTTAAARHLTVVPAEPSWFVLERSRVEDLQQQRTDSMLVLSAGSLHSLQPLGSCQAQQ